MSRFVDMLEEAFQVAYLVPPVTRLDDGQGRSPDAAWEENMITAYVLIHTEVGVVASVAADVAEIKGVASAEGLTGPYDVIARAEARNLDELGRLVIRRVQAVPGVIRTLTCAVVHL